MTNVPIMRKHEFLPKASRYRLDNFFDHSWHTMQNFMDDTFKLDVREAILHYTVEAELPGINKDEIDIEFKNGRLTVSVNRKEEEKDEKGEYIHKERCYSSMQRSIYLDGAKNSGITAGLKDGLLHITVPKEESMKRSSKIEIK